MDTTKVVLHIIYLPHPTGARDGHVAAAWLVPCGGGLDDDESDDDGVQCHATPTILATILRSRVVVATI